MRNSDQLSTESPAVPKAALSCPVKDILSSKALLLKQEREKERREKLARLGAWFAESNFLTLSS